MRTSRVLAACGSAALVAAALAGPADAGTASGTVIHTGKTQNYLVLVKPGVDPAAVASRLRSQGAEVTSVNKQIGLLSVGSDDARFRSNAGGLAGVQGVGADRVIGHAPKSETPEIDQVEQENRIAHEAGKKVRPATKHGRRAPRTDPLDSYLWGMRMIHADEAHTRTLGNRKVLVGVMDTGVQGDHPDLHANFDAARSRNFTTDMVDVDGPCETPSCVDPADVDQNGHGTHVAGTIAAAMNGFGVSGVAPNVTIVNVRAGQDSGYFFAGPTANALTYAGDAGLDAVNMSFYVDPWLYNCRGGAPEDTPEQAADQDLIIASITRALDYAHSKGVTLLGAAGNAHTDMANPGTDSSSPDYGEAPHERTIDNATCLNLPAEGPHVLGITALGPSGRKADFSNYTTDPSSGEVELSAPGGWFRDGIGTDSYRSNGNLILSTAPLGVLQAAKQVDADGNITPAGEAAGVMKQCQDKPARGTTRCGYYRWLQGTSMATPHATGVAALAISAHGRPSPHGGFGMDPDAVRRLLLTTASDHACPAGRVEDYTPEGRTPDYTATCVGTAERNGIYGEGIVNAAGVVQR